MNMDSFNLIKYVYNSQENDNTDGKSWFQFGDVLKDNVKMKYILLTNYVISIRTILSNEKKSFIFLQFIWSVSVLTVITITIYGWYYWRQWVIRGNWRTKKELKFFLSKGKNFFLWEITINTKRKTKLCVVYVHCTHTMHILYTMHDENHNIALIWMHFFWYTCTMTIFFFVCSTNTNADV